MNEINRSRLRFSFAIATDVAAALFVGKGGCDRAAKLFGNSACS
ncbi:MAG: hypothetical protein AAGI69_23740 [Cyanobacteria bacterium P01_H01_bin.21]